MNGMRTRAAWTDVVSRLPRTRIRGASPTGPTRTERVEQADVITWANEATRQWPFLAYLFAVPNAAKRSKATIGTALSTGLKAGVPDLLLPVPNRWANGLAIEMKVKGRSTSENQDRWINALRAFRWNVAVCYSAAEAIEVLRVYCEDVEPVFGWKLP